MSLLTRIFSGAPAEERILTDSSAVPPPGLDGMFGGVGAGTVGVRAAMRNMTVYACVRLLADTIASLPWQVFRYGPDGIPVEVLPTPKVIAQPCPDMDTFQWKWSMVASLALRGNSYQYITGRDMLGWPTGLLPLHPDLVNVEWHTMDTWYKPTYRVEGQVIPHDDMMHIRRFTMPGEAIGMSPIQQAANTIGLSLAAEDYGYKYFQQSANPSSVLETEQTLTPEAAREQMARWVSSHGGQRRPAVLSGGLKWRPISINPDESQFLEVRKFQRSEIAMMFGVPPHMIGDTEKTTSWGTGIEQQGIGFVTYTLRPWLSCIEALVSDYLPRGQYVRFNVDALLRGDSKSRWEAYQVARNVGAFSVDEIRAYEKLGPVPNGSGRIQAVNYAPLGYDPAKTAKLNAPAGDKGAVDPTNPGDQQDNPQDAPAGDSTEGDGNGSADG